MKRNIYSYSKLWMIFFVLMGAACTNLLPLHLETSLNELVNGC